MPGRPGFKERVVLVAWGRPQIKRAAKQSRRREARRREHARAVIQKTKDGPWQRRVGGWRLHDGSCILVAWAQAIDGPGRRPCSSDGAQAAGVSCGRGRRGSAPRPAKHTISAGGAPPGRRRAAPFPSFSVVVLVRARKAPACGPGPPVGVGGPGFTGAGRPRTRRRSGARRRRPCR